MTSHAAARTPHNLTTERLSVFDFFLFTSYNGLSAEGVVIGECFLAGDVRQLQAQTVIDRGATSSLSCLSTTIYDSLIA